MSRIVTVSISQRAFEILQKFAWGQKSRVVSDYIETLDSSNPNQEAMMENPVLPELPIQNPKIRQAKTKKSETCKASSDQAETSAKQPSTKSSEQQGTPKQLSKHLLAELSLR